MTMPAYPVKPTWWCTQKKLTFTSHLLHHQAGSCSLAQRFKGRAWRATLPSPVCHEGVGRKWSGKRGELRAEIWDSVDRDCSAGNEGITVSSPQLIHKHRECHGRRANARNRKSMAFVFYIDIYFPLIDIQSTCNQTDEYSESVIAAVMCHYLSLLHTSQAAQ